MCRYWPVAGDRLEEGSERGTALLNSGLDASIRSYDGLTCKSAAPIRGMSAAEDAALAPPETYGLCALSVRWEDLHHLRPRFSGCGRPWRWLRSAPKRRSRRVSLRSPRVGASDLCIGCSPPRRRSFHIRLHKKSLAQERCDNLPDGVGEFLMER